MNLGATTVQCQTSDVRANASATSKDDRPFPTLRRCLVRLLLVFFLITHLLPHVMTGLSSRVLAASVASPIEVTYQGDVITVKANNATRVQILQAMANQIGFDIVIYGKLSSQPIARSYLAVPLFEVFDDLLSEHNWAMLFDSPQDGSAIQGQAKVWIYGEPVADSYPQTLAQVDSQADISERIATSGPAKPFFSEQRNDHVEDGAQVSVHLRTLTEDKEVSKRRKAVFALEYIGDEEAARALEAGLGDPDPAVRILVLAALERLKADRAIPAFGQCLYGDPDPKVRLAAVEAIARQRNPAAQSFLRVAIKDKNPKVRTAAQRALRQWR